MALATHYIRAEYDVQQADKLQQETGDDAPDPWQTESLSAGFHTSKRLANAPKFVPALLPYDEWGSVAAPTHEPTLTPSDLPHGDVASWYRSLSRQGPRGPTQMQTQPQPPSPSSSATRHRTSKATPEPSSSSSPSISTPGPSARSIHATGTLSSPSARVASRRQHRRGHDWFISRAISQSQSTSAPPSPRPSSSSLADILSRHGPSTQPFRPPVFLHLGPSNKGWVMLQNQGWSEGEGLGAGSNSIGSNDALTKQTLQTRKKRTRPDSLSPPSPAPLLPTSPSRERATTKGEQEEEILIDDDDDDPIIEVRKKTHVPMIDLTLTDTESEGEDDDDSDVFHENNDEVDSPAPTPAPLAPSATYTDPTTTSDHDPRAAQTVLLTPLTTVLKSDRLGIGLKAKTEGPYRSSVKRVKRNAAAAAREDVHRAQRLLLGKGHRAFARAERLERESRQSMMAYLSEP